MLLRGLDGEMTDVIVTKDTDIIRKMIFDGVEKDTEWVNDLMKGKRLYIAWGALGKFLAENYGNASAEITKESDELAKKLHEKFDSEETNHVSIVMQEIFDIMGARVIKDERWKELKKSS
jgi:hypothetical protein